jgi:Mg2+/Co2+ transporter CorB
MLETIAAVGVLLVASAFFSFAETALTAASHPLMHQLEQDGDRRAGIVNRLRAKSDRLIGTILLGNNLVNILSSALATSALIALFGEAGVAYATLLMTCLILIFAEILPKTYAFRHANRMAPAIAPLVNVCVVAFSPFTRAVQMVVNGVLWVFGAHPKHQASIGPSADELRGAIALHTGEGSPVQRERAMLRSILDLADVEVGEIMVHRRTVTMIDADDPPSSIVAQVLASPYTRIPLWRGEPDNIVGVIHAKALLRAVQSQQEKLDTIDVVALAAKPWFVPDTTSLLDQLHAFRRRREHFSIVVDEYGTFMGIVTLEDILEEIVGDIVDEHDIPARGVVRQADGSYIVQGQTTIRDLNRKFEWGLPDEDAATIAGLILHEARRIPEVGQAFMFCGMRFQILHRHRHQITSIRVTPAERENHGTEVR